MPAARAGESETSLPYLCQPTRSLLPAEAAELVLRFDQEACRFEATVGGKGASLALLSSHQDQSSDYTVKAKAYLVSLSFEVNFILFFQAIFLFCKTVDFLRKFFLGDHSLDFLNTYVRSS